MRPCNPTAIGLPVCPYGGLTSRTRCDQCERVYQQQRGSTAQRGYGSAYQRERREVITEWVARHGWWCPGYGVPAHGVQPGRLTADHTVPVSHGGQGSALTVLCGPCNTRRGNRGVARIFASSDRP